LQADRGVAMATLILNIGEGAERFSEQRDVTSVLEGLTAAQQYVEASLMRPRPSSVS
jgi:hypothetical protein